MIVRSVVDPSREPQPVQRHELPEGTTATDELSMDVAPRVDGPFHSGQIMRLLGMRIMRQLVNASAAFSEARAGRQLRCCEAIAPRCVRWMQGDATRCILELVHSYGHSLCGVAHRSAELASAELMCPGVEFAGHMSDQQLNTVLCCPWGCELEERLQWLGGAPEFSVCASAAVLSDAEGRPNAHCCAPNARCAVIANASCASVSKQAM